MADESILTAGVEEDEETTDSEETTETYLVRDNYLSEYESDTDKDIVRQNLKVPYIDNVFNKTETNIRILEEINSAIEVHLNAEDPHGTEASIKEELNNNYVRNDGTTPFLAIQKGVDPEEDEDLVTKAYADNLVKDLLTDDDKEDILTEVETLLTSYVKSSETYDKDSAYSATEVDNLLKQYVRADGTIPFTKSQIGIDPTLDSHLATKRYADKILYEHRIEVDPHNFISTLNNRLAAYAKLKDVYTKTQTYSRSQLNSLISNAVDEQLDAATAAYKEIVDELADSLSEYVKVDGTTAFTAAQKGVDATEDNELTTLSQVNDLISQVNTSINNAVSNSLWVSSGATSCSVGCIEAGTEFSGELTLQQVCDAIFYGNYITLEVPDSAQIGETIDVVICVYGDTDNIQGAYLYQDGVLIGTYNGDDFEDGCITVESEQITGDTEFYFDVIFQSGKESTITKTVNGQWPVFVGLLPKWKTASTITMDYLYELENEDADGTMNRFIEYDGDGSSITFSYSFEDSSLRHVFLVIPASYPDLVSMSIASQDFDIEAFDVVEEIPLEVAGEDVIYTIYVYSQAISYLDQDVTFNFESE